MPVWLEDLIPRDLTAAEVTAALVFVGVILLLVALLRRRSRNRGTRLNGTADTRVGVVEWSVVDERRRLVLIRRDNVEHLVMIGGPSDVVIESNIGNRQASQTAERAAASRAPAIAARPAAAVQNAAAVATLEQAALAYAPAAAAEAFRSGEQLAASAELPEARPADVAHKPALPKARPPLAAVPLPANSQQFAAAPLPDASRRNGAAMPDGGRSVYAAAESERSSAAARRLPAPARKEPSITASTSRWAGNGQSAGTAIGEVAKSQKRLSGNRAEAANSQNGWAGHDDIEDEIGKALSIDPFPPLAFPAAPGSSGRASEAALRTSGSATAPADGSLGGLAEKLEQALAQEVRSSSPGKNRLDLELDAFTGADRVQPAAPAAQSRTISASRQPEPENRRDTASASTGNEDPPVVSLSSRRRDMGDPIEDEMARLLGELTDGARR